MRAFVPVFVVALPIVLGLALLYLYLDGRIGVATLIAACFALGAAAATAFLLHVDEEPQTDPGPWLRP